MRTHRKAHLKFMRKRLCWIMAITKRQRSFKEMKGANKNGEQSLEKNQVLLAKDTCLLLPSVR